MNSMVKRNPAVDIMRFLAAILITNSHMDYLYPEKLSFLATGGTIGNALFFFCSGFTLFLKPMDGILQFPNWYKRRINRIFPTVFAVAIISCVFFDSHKDIIGVIFGSGWFIRCILVYYIFIYFIGSYCKNRIVPIGLFIVLATAIWFFIVYDTPGFFMYSLNTSSICLLFYFLFMLLGAKIGMETDKIIIKPKRDLLLLLVSLAFFFVCLILGSKKFLLFQLLSIVPLLGIVYYLFKVGESGCIKRIYDNKVCKFFIMLIGGLCLEIYLVQRYVFTDEYNQYFPLNIFVLFVLIIVLSYLTRCFARFLSQTVNDAPYRWRDIIKV